MENAKNYNVYEENGKIYFEDENDKIELTENIIGKKILWDEHAGYILEDGRNIIELIK